MKKITKALNELQKINNTYVLSNEAIDTLLRDIKTAKVCTPIIGKFSSGKSALLNILLGGKGKILKEDITPETAVPVEIFYSSEEDHAYIVRNDGREEEISISDYKKLDVDANTVHCTRLYLNNSFLAKIPDVMLVDMPGFESGFEVHNRAIDNYLPHSLAYIVAFPADDMIVRSSVGTILKELCLHDMPLCVAITKYDKKNDDYEKTLVAMKESLKRFIGNREVTYCETSSYIGDAEELEEFLFQIQENSQEILANKFRKAVFSAAEVTENYLRTIWKSSEMSESELDEQEERLGKQLNMLNDQFSKEKDNFDLQISDCVEEIKSDVQMALEAEESSFIAMAINNQSINEKLNTVVRNAVTISVKKRFIPKVEKYLKRVTNCINDESLGDVHISFSFNTVDISKNIVSTTVAAVAAILVAGPFIGGIIAGLIAFINKVRSEKKREEEKNKIRVQLNAEVYPKILKEIGNKIEAAISKQIQLLNTSIEDEIMAQRTALEKAIEDIRKKISNEKERKENLVTDIQADLERIQMIKKEI